MAARPLGYASRGPDSAAVRARRLEIVRALWTARRPLAEIAQRLGISQSQASKLRHAAGLPPRTVHRRNRLTVKIDGASLPDDAMS